MTAKSVLPDDVRRLPLVDKLQRLQAMAPVKVKAVEVLVTAALEDEFRKAFHAGPRGGLKLKSEKGGV